MINLQLDIDNPAHRGALSALLAALGTVETVEVEPAAVQHAEPIEAAAATFREAATDALQAAVETQAEPVAEPVAEAAGEFPGQTDWAALDSKGTPYNDHIHTGTRTVNQDGTWRYKRGTDRVEAEALEARLRANGTGSTAEEPEPAPAKDYPSMFGKTTPPAGSVPTPPAAAAAAAASVPTPPAAAAVSDVPTFPALMGRISRDGVTQDRVKAACETHGVTGLPALGSRPDLVPAVYASLFSE